MATIEAIISDLEKKVARNRQAIETTLENAKRSGRQNLTQAEDAECERRFTEIDDDKKALDRAKSVKAEEDALETRLNETHPTSARSAKYDEVMRISSEPRTYGRNDDPDGKGTAFLSDVIGAFRGNPQSNERLSRHMREYEVDNKGRQTRAVGDVNTGALPNLVIPSYLTDLYAAKPSNARPFADICTPVPLPLRV